MRCSKKLVAILLAVTVVLGITGCTKKLTRENFVSELEAYGIEETDKFDILTAAMTRRTVISNYFVAEDEDEAEEYGNLTLNRFEVMPELKAKEFVLAVITEMGSNDEYYTSFVCFYKFDSDKKAQKAFDNIVEAYGDEECVETDKKSKITYCVESDVSAAETNKIGSGYYLKGDTVIVMRTQSAVDDDYKLVEQLCKKFGLVSPSAAE